jgi:hypothetical protein
LCEIESLLSTECHALGEFTATDKALNLLVSELGLYLHGLVEFQERTVVVDVFLT